MTQVNVSSVSLQQLSYNTQNTVVSFFPSTLLLNYTWMCVTTTRRIGHKHRRSFLKATLFGLALMFPPAPSLDTQGRMDTSGYCEYDCKVWWVFGAFSTICGRQSPELWDRFWRFSDLFWPIKPKSSQNRALMCIKNVIILV